MPCLPRKNSVLFLLCVHKLEVFLICYECLPRHITAAFALTQYLYNVLDEYGLEILKFWVRNSAYN